MIRGWSFRGPENQSWKDHPESETPGIGCGPAFAGCGMLSPLQACAPILVEWAHCTKALKNDLPLCLPSAIQTQ